MAYSKEQLLARLQELQIEFSKYEHPVVMTVEEQAKYVGNKGGALTKNLLLKDKKHRYYIVSALPHTKVDLKVLALRLGVGKGGLRMAPDNTLGEILQVPPGCVTPFALVNETARNVSLLLDQGFKTQDCCFFHPLSNDMSISLNTHGLDKFLKSIEKEPIYVDLEANPQVGKDQPGDLAAFVPSTSMVLPDPQENESSSQTLAGNQVSAVSADGKSMAVKAKADKPSSTSKNVKVQPANVAKSSLRSADIEKFVDEILEKTSTLFLSEITEDSIKQHGEKLGDVLGNSIRKHLTSDLRNLATIFKNIAYTEGFYAGTHHQPKRL
ncbi:hypothetical protein SLEP1_g45668 [Rubroshorea leprosula]|uniref:YbaK/aminoacyl-tRNA synthetase-associated domain-containing protein n=1 Tax=Rubroshorea leprosula TaxID=152421 RepID=A0AAV5LJW1_9ROSI|nr:hypothetical protein SLEP1_g45668 [Rubroshorea leprosula]